MAYQDALSEDLGRQLAARRKERKFTQRDVAERVMRATPRIAELEADLINGRSRRDRLSLLLDVCDTLDVVPMLVPRSRAREIGALLKHAGSHGPVAPTAPKSVFDEVYIDLGGEDEEA